tara:strand:+ start:190 stop:1269 length:1080 start_codon:yes stop_codon:yes gene_type:complete
MFIIYIYLLQKYETFTCNRNLYYVDKIFRPIRPKILSIDRSNINGNEIQLSDYIINKNTINLAISQIRLDKPKNNIYEIRGSSYDYKKGYTSYIYSKDNLDKIVNKLFDSIKIIINKTIYNKNKKLCNYNCNVILKDYRIKRLGQMNKILVIEGQLILTIDKNPRYFVLDFVVDEKNKIYSIKCSGIDNNDTYSYMKYDNEKDIISKNINILGSPLYGRYTLPKTHIYSSTETTLYNPNKKKRLDKFPYFCYGNNATNKIDCEKITSSNTKGIWDKACERNEECPYYNYNSKQGGCIQGRCQFPVGVTQISPRKFINGNMAICKNCDTKSGYNSVDKCCDDQKNRKKYPNIQGPQYIFE